MYLVLQFQHDNLREVQRVAVPGQYPALPYRELQVEDVEYMRPSEMTSIRFKV